MSGDPRHHVIQTFKNLEEPESNRPAAPQSDGLFAAHEPVPNAAVPPPRPERKPKATKPIPVGDAAFEQFWRAYPRKVGKGHALKAWRTAVKKAPADVILAGLQRAVFPVRTQYVPHASTWLNGERWADGTPTAADESQAADDWGVNAWLKRQPDAQPGEDLETHEQVPCINGWVVHRSVEMIASAARLPETWRGNLDALGRWMREDIEFGRRTVLEAIRNHAHRIRQGGGEIRSLAVFDSIVRNRGEVTPMAGGF